MQCCRGLDTALWTLLLFVSGALSLALPPPPAPCPECVQTQDLVGAEWHPANASNSLWWSPHFFDAYLPIVDVELAKVRTLGIVSVGVVYALCSLHLTDQHPSIPSQYGLRG